MPTICLWKPKPPSKSSKDRVWLPSWRHCSVPGPSRAKVPGDRGFVLRCSSFGTITSCDLCEVTMEHTIDPTLFQHSSTICHRLWLLFTSRCLRIPRRPLPTATLAARPWPRPWCSNERISQGVFKSIFVLEYCNKRMLLTFRSLNYTVSLSCIVFLCGQMLVSQQLQDCWINFGNLQQHRVL